MGVPQYVPSAIPHGDPVFSAYIIMIVSINTGHQTWTRIYDGPHYEDCPKRRPYALETLARGCTSHEYQVPPVLIKAPKPQTLNPKP